MARRAARRAARPLLSAAVAAAVAAGAAEGQGSGPRTFVQYLTGLGCQDCAALDLDAVGDAGEVPFRLSSSAFGCADADALLPSLHWVYEAARRRAGGQLPGFFVDGGANVGRATARWFAALGDTFGRRMASNESWAKCIVCSGADAAAGQGGAASPSSPPTLAVVAVEPSPANFALLQRHAVDGGWGHEAYLGLQAALGDEAGEADLAYDREFAIDEVATLLFDASDARSRRRVRVVTLDDVAAAAREAWPETVELGTGIFFLKLDIEGLEPMVLRSLATMQVRVKFLSFEYAGNVWREGLGDVVAAVFAIGFVCFLITADWMFPVSGPYWHAVYTLPIWSNLFCGQEGDPDLGRLQQLHAAMSGLGPGLGPPIAPL